MKWLSYGENVMPSDAIDRAAEAIDPFFENERSWITSGVRTPEKQLSIIVERVALQHIAKEFPEYETHLGSAYDFPVDVEGETLYWWQRAWSRLLNTGFLVNPPVPAVCLFNYINPSTKENKKGRIIPVSNHQKGLAFDIGGGKDLEEKAKRVMHASQSGKCFIKYYIREPKNNAVHVDVEPV